MVGVGGMCWREFVVVGGGFVGVCLDVQRSSGLSGGTSNKDIIGSLLDFSFTIPAKTAALLARI